MSSGNVPDVQNLETETLSGKVGAMLSAEYVGNYPASQKFLFLSGPSLQGTSGLKLLGFIRHYYVQGDSWKLTFFMLLLLSI